MAHQCTLNDLEKQRLAILRKQLLTSESKKKENPGEKIADSNNYFFDRKKSRIIKKGQLTLL